MAAKRSSLLYVMRPTVRRWWPFRRIHDTCTCPIRDRCKLKSNIANFIENSTHHSFANIVNHTRQMCCRANLCHNDRVILGTESHWLIEDLKEILIIVVYDGDLILLLLVSFAIHEKVLIQRRLSRRVHICRIIAAAGRIHWHRDVGRIDAIVVARWWNVWQQ